MLADARRAPGARSTAPQLIAYADRMGGSIRKLSELLRGPLAEVFQGIHILPFYRPFDGVDAGFDPEDHAEVDARLGSWDDIRQLSLTHEVMADLIVNHVSANSTQFQDVAENGDDSRWADMFLTFGSVFPEGATESDLALIYRPRPGLPFTAVTLGGQPRLVWTTFTSNQIDLDIRSAKTWDYLSDVIDRMTEAGVGMLRLDAVGYVGKVPGTNCFMTDEALAFAQRLREYAHEHGTDVLLEVHGHYQQQIEIAKSVDLVYDFALPPLILHALTAGDAGPLAHWLEVRPANTVTVLDTHDGIGIVDVGSSPLRPGEPGLLTNDQIDRLVEVIHDNSAGTSRLATGAAASNLDLYQVNCTFYDALGADDLHYLLARLIQLFVPGIPQVYYVGLLAGRNDVTLLERTGVGRDVNRHYYRDDEIAEALHRSVVRAQLAALRLRRSHPAFKGDFTYHVDGQQLTLKWIRGSDELELTVNLGDLSHRLTSRDGEHDTVTDDVMTLADRDETAASGGSQRQ
jgi:sucrose phosphorylase